MMKTGILAQRYARALCELALERTQLDQVRHDLHDFVTRLEEQPQLAYFLISPETGRAAKREAVERALRPRYSVLFFNFLLLLIDKGRLPLFREIERAFNDLYDRHHRKMRALAISATPMDRSTIAALQQDLSRALNLTLEIENRVDPQILGGLVLNLGGRIMDGSVRRQLQRLLETVSGRSN